MRMDIKIKFGKVIRFLRKQKQLSQETLAELSGLDRSYVGGVERGERNVSIVNVEKLAKALDVDIENIFSRIREEYDENTNY